MTQPREPLAAHLDELDRLGARRGDLLSQLAEVDREIRDRVRLLDRIHPVPWGLWAAVAKATFHGRTTILEWRKGVGDERPADAEVGRTALAERFVPR